MSKSQETFGKKEVEKRKSNKKKAKEARRQARKEKKSQSLDDMIAYVDADGNITDTPPDPNEKKEIPIEEIEISVSKDEKDHDESQGKHMGRVTYYNELKGFGFIKESGSGESIFVHVNQVVTGEMTKDCKVTFDKEASPKGPTATNVHVKD